MSQRSNLSTGKKSRSNNRAVKNQESLATSMTGDTAPVIPVDLEMEDIDVLEETPVDTPTPLSPSLEPDVDVHYDAPVVEPSVTPVGIVQPIRPTSESEVISVVKPSTVAVAPHPASVYTDIVSFLRVILVNGWIILLMAALGAGGAYLYSKTEPKIYESTTSVIVVPGAGDVKDEVNLINILKVNLVGTYVQILLSRDRTVEPTYAELAKRYDEKLIKKALIDIIPVANSTVITITVNSTDPQLAKDMADTLADQAIKNSPEEYATVYPLEVLDKADDPGDPISPQPRLMVVMGGAGSAVAGIAIAFFLDGYVKYRRSLKAATTSQKTA